MVRTIAALPGSCHRFQRMLRTASHTTSNQHQGFHNRLNSGAGLSPIRLALNSGCAAKTLTLRRTVPTVAGCRRVEMWRGGGRSLSTVAVPFG